MGPGTYLSHKPGDLVNCIGQPVHRVYFQRRSSMLTGVIQLFADDSQRLPALSNSENRLGELELLESVY
jgi:hypothetical protein